MSPTGKTPPNNKPSCKRWRMVRCSLRSIVLANDQRSMMLAIEAMTASLTSKLTRSSCSVPIGAVICVGNLARVSRHVARRL